MIEFKNVTKCYLTGENYINAVNQISFTIQSGEFVIVLGPSGAGKSTILNLLGGMDTISKGEIIVNKENITHYNDRQLSNYRANQIGFVFQFYNLLPTLTAYENVALIKEVNHQKNINVENILEAVGLKERMYQFPNQLSGGEQQRVSIARALAKKPSLLLCDEPTGALDSSTGVTILGLLKKMCNQYKKTVVVVTHNSAYAQIADKVIKVKNGEIEDIIINQKPMEVNEVHW